MAERVLVAKLIHERNDNNLLKEYRYKLIKKGASTSTLPGSGNPSSFGVIYYDANCIILYRILIFD